VFAVQHHRKLGGAGFFVEMRVASPDFEEQDGLES
jgi:hypothetical protein